MVSTPCFAGFTGHGRRMCLEAGVPGLTATGPVINPSRDSLVVLIALAIAFGLA